MVICLILKVYIFSLLFTIYYYLVLDQDNSQDMTAMAPLNDLLLGQTFLIETNEQPLFINDAQVKNIVTIPLLFDIDIFFPLQLITFENIDSNGQISDIQTISNDIESDKSTIENINFSMNSDDDFQNIYTDCNWFILYNCLLFLFI